MIQRDENLRRDQRRALMDAMAKRYSNLWKYFLHSKETFQVKCKVCNEILQYDGIHTSKLIKHLQINHDIKIQTNIDKLKEKRKLSKFKECNGSEKSSIWKYFLVCKVTSQAKCKLCGKCMSVTCNNGNSPNNTQLMRHIEKYHKNEAAIYFSERKKSKLEEKQTFSIFQDYHGKAKCWSFFLVCLNTLQGKCKICGFEISVHYKGSVSSKNLNRHLKSYHYDTFGKEKLSIFQEYHGKAKCWSFFLVCLKTLQGKCKICGVEISVNYKGSVSCRNLNRHLKSHHYDTFGKENIPEWISSIKTPEDINKFVKAKDKTKSTDHFDVKNKNLKSNNPSTVTSNRICSENEVPDSEKKTQGSNFCSPLFWLLSQEFEDFGRLKFAEKFDS